MTEQQKQLVDFFKIYSLETPHIKKVKNFSKHQLIESIKKQTDPGVQKVNDSIIRRIMFGRKQNIEYLGTDGTTSSSNETNF